MADHGNPTPKDTMTLNFGEDHVVHFELQDDVFDEGFEMFYRFRELNPVVEWPFVISGSDARLKVESEEADTIRAREVWQLMTREDSDPTTETELCWGTVKRSH